MILLAVPTRDAILAGCTGDLIRLCRRHPDVRFLATLGIYIANLRQSAVHVARQVSASHILFIDSDMRFPDDTLDRLLSADRPIVAANYIQRTMPDWWVARRDGQSVSSGGKTGLEPVESVGCGVMLIELTVFDRVPPPWFDTPYNGQTHLGEDRYFCQHARAHGLSVWIDHDLSQRVRHTGSVELGAAALVPA